MEWIHKIHYHIDIKVGYINVDCETLNQSVDFQMIIQHLID